MADEIKAKELTLADLVARMEAQDEKLAELEKQNLALKGKITETAIGGEPEAMPTIPTALVERSGRKYKWMCAQFHRHGFGPITAEEASTDTDIIDDVLAIEGQGLLVEVV